MPEVFSENAWLVAVAVVAIAAVIIAVASTACISFNVCRRKIRLAQFDFELKQDMLQRGMSAVEIRTVIEAGRPAAFDYSPSACSDHRLDIQNGTGKSFGDSSNSPTDAKTKIGASASALS
jgi:hypothetical protein